MEQKENPNFINYKERYIEIAFRKGFEKLLRNILKIEDQKKIFSTELATIKSFLQSYRIVDEQEIEGKYRVEISLIFKEELINQFFQKKLTIIFQRLPI